DLVQGPFEDMLLDLAAEKPDFRDLGPEARPKLRGELVRGPVEEGQPIRLARVTVLEDLDQRIERDGLGEHVATIRDEPMARMTGDGARVRLLVVGQPVA